MTSDRRFRVWSLDYGTTPGEHGASGTHPLPPVNLAISDGAWWRPTCAVALPAFWRQLALRSPQRRRLPLRCSLWMVPPSSSSSCTAMTYVVACSSTAYAVASWCPHPLRTRWSAGPPSTRGLGTSFSAAVSRLTASGSCRGLQNGGHEETTEGEGKDNDCADAGHEQ
jgi:hypothetical protein